MFCFLYKWMISRSFDIQKPLSASTKKHIRQCPSCRNLFDISRTLEETGIRDPHSLYPFAPQGLENKIWARLEKQPLPKQKTNRSPILVSVYSGALAVIFLFIFVIFKPFSPSPSMTDILKGSFHDFFHSRPTVQTLVDQAEDPYEKEMLSLKTATTSAATYLKTSLKSRFGLLAE